MKYVNDFFKWADEVFNEFCSDSDKIRRSFDSTTGITIVYDLRTGKTAFSKCRKDEKFIEKVGIAVAYTRLKGREVPKERKWTFVKYLTTGDKFILRGMPPIEYNIVGVNPINPTEMIAICKIGNTLRRFDFYNEVYKIN